MFCEERYGLTRLAGSSRATNAMHIVFNGKWELEHSV